MSLHTLRVLRWRPALADVQKQSSAKWMALVNLLEHSATIAGENFASGFISVAYMGPWSQRTASNSLLGIALVVYRVLVFAPCDNCH